VAFLDEKTGEIDGLVSQVEREIELLKEYKQAEIARVVTKGLNPMRPCDPAASPGSATSPPTGKHKKSSSHLRNDPKRIILMSQFFVQLKVKA